MSERWRTRITYFLIGVVLGLGSLVWRRWHTSAPKPIEIRFDARELVDLREKRIELRPGIGRFYGPYIYVERVCFFCDNKIIIHENVPFTAPEPRS